MADDDDHVPELPELLSPSELDQLLVGDLPPFDPSILDLPDAEELDRQWRESLALDDAVNASRASPVAVAERMVRDEPFRLAVFAELRLRDPKASEYLK